MQMSFENGLEIRHIVLALKVNVVLMLIPRSKDKSNYQMQWAAPAPAGMSRVVTEIFCFPSLEQRKL